MSVFESINDIFKNLFSIKEDVWVQRISTSKNDIEKCNGEAYRDEATNSCELCVALNKTVFKNHNKPEYYHPNCRCKNRVYDLKDVVLDFSIDKITNYLFVNPNKHAMMRSMGYSINDAVEVYKTVHNAVRQQFLSGNYLLKKLDKHGQRFTINFHLKGKREHINKVFACHTGCVAWPNGKIKIATPLIKD